MYAMHQTMEEGGDTGRSRRATGVAQTSLSRIGEGLASFSEVPELGSLVGLRSLCLHGNNIVRIEGIQHLASLTDLNISSNCIASPAGLGALTCLMTLNLASNRLTHLAGLDYLPNLATLNLSYNALTSLSGLAALHASGSCKLRVLNVRSNQLVSLSTLSVLAGLPALRELGIAGNPLCAAPGHQQLLLSVMPQVAKLDGIAAADVLAMPLDGAAAALYAAQQLDVYQHGGGTPTQQQGYGGAVVGSPHLLRGWQGGRQSSVVSPTSAADTPAIDAALAGYCGRQQQPQQHQQQYGQSSSPARDGSSGAGPLNMNVLPHNAPGSPGMGGGMQAGRQSANWAAGQTSTTGRRSLARPGDASSATDQQQRQQQQQHHHHHSKVQHPHVAQLRYQQQQQQQPGKGSVLTGGMPYLMDEAVQTVEGGMSELGRCQEQARLLREQLVQVTDELERRNVVEARAAADMQVAMQAATDEAHARMEEGYREASQAVCAALRELEVTRLQLAGAQAKADSVGVREQETAAKTAALAAELERAHQELASAREQAGFDSTRAVSTLHTTRREAADAADALQQQLASVEGKLAGVGRELGVELERAAAAEARAAAADAALQQTNSMTVLMTARMAAGMADANAVAEGLRSRVAAAEAAEAEARRAEGGARAENLALAESLTATRKLHASELECQASSLAEEWGAKMAREVASSEEHARARAAAAAEKERGALQEQITFLKVQLQYALKESDKEAEALGEALASARAEAEELKGALATSSSKHSEHEALVADLTHVLTQQKALIQRLERDKAALAGRLRDAQPERFEALLSEISSLRRANAELDVLRGQVAHTQRAWHESERRAVEAAATAAAALQDVSGRADRAEAAVDAAREEVRTARRDAERAEKKLGSTEDAIKVKNAMLDSANDTIEQLKADIAELQSEVEDARRAADDAEALFGSGCASAATDSANLRSEIEAGEAALEAMAEKLSAAGAKAAEAESELVKAHETLAEKERMLGYVNEEVDRVKGMFEAREARLRGERDVAQREARDACDAAAAAHTRARSLESQLSETAAGLEAARSDASTARAVAEGAVADAAAARAKVTEAEEEMRTLLDAVERQKASSASKMKQLAHILQDL